MEWIMHEAVSAQTMYHIKMLRSAQITVHGRNSNVKNSVSISHSARFLKIRHHQIHEISNCGQNIMVRII